MNAPVNYVQSRRLLAISTSLGQDVLLLERLEGHEGISSLFEFHATVRSKRDIRPAEIIGSAVDITLDLGVGKGLRTWNGLVTELSEGPAITRVLRSYALTIRPKLWLATQRQDCRIWLDKTSLQIAEVVLGEHGIPAPDLSGVTITPKPLTYSVQSARSTTGGGGLYLHLGDTPLATGTSRPRCHPRRATRLRWLTCRRPIPATRCMSIPACFSRRQKVKQPPSFASKRSRSSTSWPRQPRPCAHSRPDSASLPMRLPVPSRPMSRMW